MIYLFEYILGLKGADKIYSSATFHLIFDLCIVFICLPLAWSHLFNDLKYLSVTKKKKQRQKKLLRGPILFHCTVGGMHTVLSYC